MFLTAQPRWWHSLHMTSFIPLHARISHLHWFQHCSLKLHQPKFYKSKNQDPHIVILVTSVFDQIPFSLLPSHFSRLSRTSRFETSTKIHRHDDDQPAWTSPTLQDMQHHIIQLLNSSSSPGSSSFSEVQAGNLLHVWGADLSAGGLTASVPVYWFIGRQSI